MFEGPRFSGMCLAGRINSNDALTPGLIFECAPLKLFGNDDAAAREPPGRTSVTDYFSGAGFSVAATRIFSFRAARLFVCLRMVAEKATGTAIMTIQIIKINTQWCRVLFDRLFFFLILLALLSERVLHS